MLTKREIRKQGYKAIIKQKEEHQVVYDRLKTNDQNDNHFLAKELSKIPSLKILDRNKNYLFTFIGLMGLILIMRVAAIIYLLGSRMDPAILLLFVVGGIFAPAMGVFGAVTKRLHLFQSVSFVFIIMLYRTVQDGLLIADNAYMYAPFVVAILLGFWIPYKLKTPFKFASITTKQDDKEITYKDYQFEKGSFSRNEDLLDDDL